MRENISDVSDERIGIENILKVIIGPEAWKEAKWTGLSTYELVGLCIAEIMFERYKKDSLLRGFNQAKKELAQLQQLDLSFFPDVKKAG